MQIAQGAGVTVGLLFIVIGFLARKHFKEKSRPVAAGVSMAILVYYGFLMVFQNLLFEYPATATWEGLIAVWTRLLGGWSAPVIFAFLGFFYKRDKVAGYVACLLGFSLLIMFAM